MVADSEMVANPTPPFLLRSAQLGATAKKKLGFLAAGIREAVGEGHYTSGILAVLQAQGVTQLVNRFF